MKIIRDVFSGITIAAVLLFIGFLISLAWTNPTLPPPQGSGMILVEGTAPYNVGVKSSPSASFDPDYKLDVDAGGAENFGFQATGIGNFFDKLIIGDPNLGGTPASKSKLHLVDGSFTQDNPANPIFKGGANLGSDCTRGCILQGNALRVRAAGRYAYLTFAGGESDKFQIIDVSDPAVPKIVGALSSGLPSAIDLAVAGRYAYITFSGVGINAFRIVDISNPQNPSIVGGSNLTARMPISSPVAVFVAGKYAYVTFSGPGSDAFRIIDVSDPTNPVVVGGDNLTNADFPKSANYGIHVSGRYAYINLACIDCSSGTESMRILDISNPAAPLVKGKTLSSGGVPIPNAQPVDIYVSGRYAYISFNSAGSPFRVIDISDPESPKVVGQIAGGIPFAPISLTGSGSYVYLGSPTGSSLRIIDVSKPTAPVVVGSILSGLPSTNTGIAISGRYVYMSFNQPHPNALRIIEIPGIEAVSGHTSSLESGSLQVRENAAVDNNLSVRGGLTVGGSILGSDSAAFGELLLRNVGSGSGNNNGIKIFTASGSNTCNAGCSAYLAACLAGFISNSGQPVDCNFSDQDAKTCLCAKLGK